MISNCGVVTWHHKISMVSSMCGEFKLPICPRFRRLAAGFTPDVI